MAATKKAEENLMDLLVKIRGLEDRCKHLETVTAVPPKVYATLGTLRDQIAEWGIECVIRAGKGEVESPDSDAIEGAGLRGR